jgi:hypothetical protein
MGLVVQNPLAISRIHSIPSASGKGDPCAESVSELFDLVQPRCQDFDPGDLYCYRQIVCA